MLYIIRGLPGSGKSTLAKELDIPHFEADMYFIDSDGNYNFDRGLIADAHNWCKQQVRDILVSGKDVVVSNTFVRKWEVEPYLIMAAETGHEVQIITAKGEFKNIHGVPDEVVERMRDNWEEF